MNLHILVDTIFEALWKFQVPSKSKFKGLWSLFSHYYNWRTLSHEAAEQFFSIHCASTMSCWEKDFLLINGLKCSHKAVFATQNRNCCACMGSKMPGYSDKGTRYLHSSWQGLGLCIGKRHLKSNIFPSSCLSLPVQHWVQVYFRWFCFLLCLSSPSLQPWSSLWHCKSGWWHRERAQWTRLVPQ